MVLLTSCIGVFMAGCDGSAFQSSAAEWLGKRFGWEAKKQSPSIPPPTSTVDVSVSALGTIEPTGDVHVLAGPVIEQGGIPRLNSLEVNEGDRILQGQILATFDNAPKLAADRTSVLAQIRSVDAQINLLNQEIQRFRTLKQEGAFPASQLESRELELLQLRAQRTQLASQLGQIDARAKDSVLRSPLNGYVLKIHTRVGERPHDEGVMDVGNSDILEAVLQVDESQISSVNIGQRVVITSRNNAFKGDVSALVSQISSSVTRRKQLTDSPSADTDREARVIEVRAVISPQYVPLLKSLIGTKIKGTFE